MQSVPSITQLAHRPSMGALLWAKDMVPCTSMGALEHSYGEIAWYHALPFFFLKTKSVVT